jgi:hypothetical protein
VRDSEAATACLSAMPNGLSEFSPEFAASIFVTFVMLLYE